MTYLKTKKSRKQRAELLAEFIKKMTARSIKDAPLNRTEYPTEAEEIVRILNNDSRIAWNVKIDLHDKMGKLTSLPPLESEQKGAKPEEDLSDLNCHPFTALVCKDETGEIVEIIKVSNQFMSYGEGAIFISCTGLDYYTPDDGEGLDVLAYATPKDIDNILGSDHALHALEDIIGWLVYDYDIAL